MRGTIAKRCRKILFALQVKKRAPQGSEYKIHQRSGQIVAFGAREVYQGMKRAYRERGGFHALPRRIISARDLAEKRREQARARKRKARTAKTQERHAVEPWVCACGYTNMSGLCNKCGAQHGDG